MVANNILVTGIGGNVGQGILRNLRESTYDLRLVGSNVSITSTGNHLCDKVYELPYAYDTDYIHSVRTLCEEEDIHLVIPSTDYESLYLAKYRKTLPEVAACPCETMEVLIDKVLVSHLLNVICHRSIKGNLRILLLSHGKAEGRVICILILIAGMGF